MVVLEDTNDSLLRRGEAREGAIYVHDIMKLVIILCEPTSFLIAGN